MTRPRIEVTPALKQQVREFFEDKCALCDTTVMPLHVAHVFDDSKERPSFDRLMLLCANHNEHYDYSKRRWTTHLHGSCSPDSVASLGNQHWMNGEYKRSYAAHRLAAWLFDDRLADPDKALESLIYCISDLRPIRQAALLKAVILHVESLCRNYRSKVSPFWVWQFLDRLALTLYDFSRWDLGLWVALKAIEYSRIEVSSMYQRTVEVAHLNSTRRQVQLKVVNQGSLPRGKTVKTLLAEFRELSKGLLDRKDINGYVTSLHVLAMLSLDVLGDKKSAENYVREALVNEPKVSNKWVIAELHWLLSRLMNKDREKKQVIRELATAIDIARKHGIVFEPYFSNGKPLQPNLDEVMATLGIKQVKDMRKHGIDALPPLPPRMSLDLSDSDVQRIVATVSQGAISR
jgi:hypothetical protein